VDFSERTELDASLYEGPFEILSKQWVAENERRKVAGERDLRAGEEATRVRWWIHQRARPELDSALAGFERFIATTEVSKHRVFVWMEGGTKASGSVYSIARSDDTTFGILHSRFHELWSLRMGTSLEDRPRYTSTTTFETFPFPEGLTPRDTAQATERASPTCYAGTAQAENIAAAARSLNSLREAWLNPPEWVDWVRTPEEAAAGFPERPVAKPGHEAELKKRTLTNLYNARPAWLDHAHRDLDAAVAAAYGWDDYTPEMPDDEILRRLLALNLARSSDQ
jgi:hypothetical protein